MLVFTLDHLSFERNLHRAAREQIAGKWGRYGGIHGELQGKRLTVIGVGAIGGRVAELGTAFGMTIVRITRDLTMASDIVDKLYGPDELVAALVDTDYIAVICPLTEKTRGLIEAGAFTKIPEKAVLVNVDCGAIVDESVLIKVLREECIRGATLEVFEEDPIPKDSSTL